MHAALREAAEAQDLAPVELNAEIAHIAVFRGDVPYIQHHLVAGGAVEIRPVVAALELPAHHQRPHVVHPDGLALQVADHDAVAQAGDFVAHPLELLQVVGNEDHALLRSPHLVDELIDELASLLRQGGGGLVDHQDLRIQVHGSGDFHDFSVLEVQLAHRRVGADVSGTDLLKDLGCLGVHLLNIQKSPLAEHLIVAHEDVGRHIHLHQGAGLLNNHGHARLLRLDHIVGCVGGSCPEHLAAGGRLHAGKNGSQR